MENKKNSINNLTDNPSLNKGINKLENTQRLPHELNREKKDSIFDICRSFNDIFHLEGDRLIFTDAITHSIPTREDQSPLIVVPKKTWP